MKMNVFVVFVFCFFLMAVACTKQSSSKSADLVLLNGKILTMDSENAEVDALAIKGDTVIALGSDEDIQSYVSENTEVIDMKGMLAVPGLIDGHGHYMSLGESLTRIDLRPVKTWEEIVDLVAQEVEKAKPGEWIVGRGWHQDKWIRPPEPNMDGLPLHHGLSAISPENPVLLIHVSGHGVFVNARAMDMAGIYANTLEPIGGEIVRDADGNPTGMLRETAQDGAREALARFRALRSLDEIETEMRNHVRLAGEEALANGITTFHDMGETFETIDLFKRMAEEGSLPVRLCAAIQEPARILEEKMAMYRMVGYGDGYLTVRAIGEKVLDGALGTHGGLLLEPYSDKPESAGFIVTPIEDIQRSAELAIQHDYQMEIQGIGDRACRELLDIYEEQFAQNPDKEDFRWRIEHCQVIHPADLPRFRQLGVIASIRGVFATSDGPWVINRLGEERTRERGYLYRSLFQSGAIVINGTDPPVEDIDPIDNFYRSVTRKMGNGSVFYPEQRLTRQQALESYTVNPAFAAFEEDIKGTLEPGKLADITVFSKDIMTIPEEEILSTKIAYTIIGGKIKFDGSIRLE
jgi:predicted amidohydrolase YtcJ